MNDNLKKLGLESSKYDFTLALAGNPNTGKSTVFNTLTGLRQHTGNWPGKTVTRAEGAFDFNGSKYRIIDLPGTYSLLSTSTDEEIARDFILFGKPDATIIVADATRLERNLNLVLQVLEITDKAILCVNLIDEAKRNNIEIDFLLLEKELGIPVVPTSARKGTGIDMLLEKTEKICKREIKTNPRRIKVDPDIESQLTDLIELIETNFPDIENSRWVALRLLEGDQRIIDAVKSNELGYLDRKDVLQTEEF